MTMGLPTAFSEAGPQKPVAADIHFSKGRHRRAIFEALNARGKPLTGWPIRTATDRRRLER